ncbi:MAG: RNA polymerase sigma factor [Chitinophagaceae bacterium]
MQALMSHSDTALLELIEQHHEEAMAVLLHRYKSRFYTTAYLLVKDRYLAEDLFQEACIKIIRSVREGKYKHDDKFLAWALRITRNLCYDYLRSAKRGPKMTNSEGQDIFATLHFSDHNTPLPADIESREDRVRGLLHQLPYEQREVVVLRLYADLSFKEIADLTGVSINTALGRMRYALLNLKKWAVNPEMV